MYLYVSHYSHIFTLLMLEGEQDIDPDQNLLNNVNANCSYYIEEQLKDIYRKPGSNIDKFNSYMERLFTSTKQKDMYVCGDYNIDLMNPNPNHKATDEFIEVMNSMGLYPTITKPTRVTSSSACLIDNIFTNNMEHKMRSGELMNYISDHLPVFLTSECNYKEKRKSKEIIYKRIRTDKD